MKNNGKYYYDLMLINPSGNSRILGNVGYDFYKRKYLADGKDMSRADAVGFDAPSEGMRFVEATYELSKVKSMSAKQFRQMYTMRYM